MDQQIKETISNEIKGNDVCLFMKGSPDAPQCGFSLAVSGIIIPEAVFSSAASGSTRTLSAKGLKFTLLIFLIVNNY